MHITSLYGDYSCGSFGNEAKEFIDFLSECGFGWWQVLPFCMADECNSPYKSYSAFGGNPYFIDISILNKKGFITLEELNKSIQQTPYSCEYERLNKERINLLKKASQRAKDKGEKEKIDKFIKEHPHIAKFCEFMALKTANNDKCWNEWDTDIYDEDELFAWQFIEYEFFSQWYEIKSYANSKGIKILGDMPFYVSYDSSDVWANRELFYLNSDCTMKRVAGVPPDYFSKTGQLWGNPLYNWDKMKKDNYLWWQDRIKAMLSMFDGVRIDHFRAIESFWSVDAKAKTAQEGKWVKGPGMDLIDKINFVKSDGLIVAEDLGLITDEVEALVEKSGFPGMRVLQFAFLDEGDNPHLPHNYKNNTVAYTGTHDNNTLLGYIWEMDEKNRRYMFDYCGNNNSDWDDGLERILRMMFSSNAGLVVFPLQDLLRYGSDTRLNVPGRKDGNWLYRVTRGQLNEIDKNKYKKLNSLYKR